MDLRLTGVDNQFQHEPLVIHVAYGEDLDDGYSEANFKIELSGVGYMNMTLNELQAKAVKRVASLYK
mgnify:CR=1 FL=1